MDNRMRIFYILLYRIYFLFEDLFLASRGRRIANALRRHVLPGRDVLVRVQSGLSRGMWVRVRLPEEVRYWRGMHDRAVQEAVSAGAGPGAVIYDIGAHIGIIALGSARLVGKTGCVVAFDADPHNAASLRESCSLNGLDDCVRVVHAAVWSSTADDGIVFRRGGACRSQGGVEADGYRPVLGRGEAIKVPSVTLDDFIRSGGRLPQLVKIDVEGGEYEVLRGGHELFSGPRPLVIAEIHQPRALEQITGWLCSFRYDARWDIPPQGYPRTMFAWPDEPSGARFSRPATGRHVREGFLAGRSVASMPDRTRESETAAAHPPSAGLRSSWR
jgi:FkbM family methyltransferase